MARPTCTLVQEPPSGGPRSSNPSRRTAQIEALHIRTTDRHDSGERIAIVGAGATGTYVLEPYGFLYGNTRPYLIGYVPARRGIRHFSLADITALELIPETFAPDPHFSLAKFAERSFGVFQETDGPFDVVWKFTPYGARDARQFQFHPSQTVEEHKDGSITVRFQACGLKEMVWHLLTWDEHVEIIEPEALKEAYSELLHKLKKTGKK